MYDLYGVISGGADSMTVNGEEGSRHLYAVPYGDISCVVSGSRDPIPVSDKKGVLEKLLGYQRVMEALVKGHTVIPIKFGSRLETKGDVAKVLENGYDEFRRRLDEFEGKIEVDVAASWKDIGEVIKRVAEKDKTIKGLKEEIQGLPAAGTLAERVRLGSLIKNALDRRRDALLEKTTDALGALANRSKRQEITDDGSVFRCAFLIERSLEEAFYPELEELSKGLHDEVNFRCISPLPPYAFSTLEVKRVACEEIRRARDILGLGEGSSPDAVKGAYLARAHECHPDAAERAGQEKEFEEVARAYKLLSSLSGGKRTVRTTSGDCFYVEPVRD